MEKIPKPPEPLKIPKPPKHTKKSPNKEPKPEKLTQDQIYDIVAGLMDGVDL